MQYVKFLASSVNAHGLHSPFVFELYNSVIKDDKRFYAFEAIEKVRVSLKGNQNKLNQVDYGQGSVIDSKTERTIASIASNALSFPYQCRIMFRLVDFLKPSKTLELGTSLGISASYLALADKNNQVYTLEGDPNSLSVAEQVFKGFKLKNIHTVLGPFDQTLATTLSKLKTFDLIFMDGHHDEEATIKYYEMIKPHCHSGSAIIVDDIYWSKGMQSAWKRIIDKPEVTLSLDLYFCGIVFFRKENKEKEHFKLRPDHFLYFR